MVVISLKEKHDNKMKELKICSQKMTLDIKKLVINNKKHTREIRKLDDSLKLLRKKLPTNDKLRFSYMKFAKTVTTKKSTVVVEKELKRSKSKVLFAEKRFGYMKFA